MEIIGYHIDSLLDDRTVDEASVEKMYAKVPSRFTSIGDVAVGEDVADAVWYFAAHAATTQAPSLLSTEEIPFSFIPLFPQIK